MAEKLEEVGSRFVAPRRVRDVDASSVGEVVELVLRANRNFEAVRGDAQGARRGSRGHGRGHEAESMDSMPTPRTCDAERTQSHQNGQRLGKHEEQGARRQRDDGGG